LGLYIIPEKHQVCTSTVSLTKQKSSRSRLAGNPGAV
jgi:hypothetical protein